MKTSFGLSLSFACFSAATLVIPCAARASVPDNELSYEASLPEELASNTPTGPNGGESCPLLQMNVNEFNWVGGIRRDAAELTEAGEKSSCLQSTIRDGLNRCRDAVSPDLRWRDMDDCLVLGYFMHMPQVVSLFGLQDVPYRPATVEGALAESSWYFRKHSCSGVCHQGKLFFDDECHAVTNLTTQQIDNACDGGSFNWATPISLLWDSAADIDENVAFTQFQLDPAKTGMWYTWKASAAAPLLVYDPEHKGVVRSATQLFGNWAFGGKVTAALASSTRSSSMGVNPWRDGFEALATLDTDASGALEKDELRSLGLWFDRNRDGVSQPGEVVSLQTAGVSRLSVKPDRTDSLTKTIFATNGYERNTAQGVIRGGLADWYGESASSEHELVGRQSMRAALCSKGSEVTLNNLSQTPSDPALDDSLTAKRFETRTPLSGVWRWKIVSDSENVLKNHGGIITFSGVGKDGINGHTIVEISVKEMGGGLSKMMQILPFTGTVTKNDLGETVASFTLPSGDAAANTESSATLSAEGELLNGTSKTTVLYKGRKMKFEYRWVAERL
ncbi:MAG: hypothetical protein U0136_16690 [Bdellovibrionota bacterium]